MASQNLDDVVYLRRHFSALSPTRSSGLRICQRLVSLSVNRLQRSPLPGRGSADGNAVGTDEGIEVRHERVSGLG